MSSVIIPLVAMFSVFGFPTALLGLHIRQRHREKMQLLETQAGARQVAALEASRADLEMRVRTLESIVTSGDRELEARLRRLESIPAAQPPRLPPGS